MYVIEDVTNRYSADHITDLGSMNKRPDRRFRVNEVYIMNGLDNSDTEATQITMLNGFSKKPLTIKPTTWPRIGSGNSIITSQAPWASLGSYAPNYMTRSTLSSMSDDVQSLQKQIDSQAKVPAWAESYIYTAGDRMNTVEEYMSHRQGLSGASNLGFGFDLTEDFPFIEPDEELAATLTLLGVVFTAYLFWTPITGIIRNTFGVIESATMRGRPKEEKTKKHEGDIMADPDALNALIENYLDRVDDLITAYRMDPKRGTDVLDPIQEEVDGTIDRLRMNAPHSTVSTLRLDSNRSLERLENTLCAITNQNLSGLAHFQRPVQFQISLGSNMC